MKRKFRVSLFITECHEYEVEARSPEEAENVAEQLFLEGEEGAITSSSPDAWDVEPVEAE